MEVFLAVVHGARGTWCTVIGCEEDDTSSCAGFVEEDKEDKTK